MIDYRNLEAWQRAHELTLGVYRETSGFPPSEMSGLITQMRRAAASIGSNIAEGSGHDSPRQLIKYLGYAKASASEVGYQLLLSRDLGFIDDTNHRRLAQQVTGVRQMLHRLQESIERRHLDRGGEV